MFAKVAFVVLVACGLAHARYADMEAEAPNDAPWTNQEYREDMGFDAESAWQREASPEWNDNDDDFARSQSDELNGGYWPENEYRQYDGEAMARDTAESMEAIDAAAMEEIRQMQERGFYDEEEGDESTTN
ncbi:uncharacterized protein [Oscarella lobularis]|uniref:uncharacterized protein n=1 Tax=Oscarella lobularis TaxID=121494 RepID=UPI003313B065